MADDNSARYRSNDGFGRGPAPANDPLAELARLIGQGDPYTDYNNRPPNPPVEPAQPRAADDRWSSEPVPSFLTNPAQHYGHEPAQRHSEPAPQQYQEPAPQQYSEPAPQQYAAEPEPQHYSEPAPQAYAPDPASRYSSAYPSHNDWPGSPPSHAYPANDPYPAPAQHPAMAPAAQQHYANTGYANPQANYPNPPYPESQGRPGVLGYQPESAGPAGYEAAHYPGPQDRPGPGAPFYPHQPNVGSMPLPQDDELYEDEPRGRRKGLLTVMAVLALAVVGTAGAFGYRSLFGGSAGVLSTPPVIRASGEPSKVAPPPASTDPSASKFSYDRFGDAGKDEQVVKREEKPVDVSRVTTAPRTVLPGAPVPSPPSTKSPGAASASNAPSAIGEPRRVRTVPIRPDDAAATTTPSQSPPSSVAPPRQANAAAVANAPSDEPAPRAAPPRASSRVALRSSPPPAANAPLSLSPDANNTPAPAVQETAPPPAPRAAAPATRVASAPVSGGGSFLVQVSSQKSEADAESSYRGIQSKYSSVLGSQPHQVKRADLGAKGVYYRAMVGPFASREAAVQLCSSLKQAGGDCVVQH